MIDFWLPDFCIITCVYTSICSTFSPLHRYTSSLLAVGGVLRMWLLGALLYHAILLRTTCKSPHVHTLIPQCIGVIIWTATYVCVQYNFGGNFCLHTWRKQSTDARFSKWQLKSFQWGFREEAWVRMPAKCNCLESTTSHENHFPKGGSLSVPKLHTCICEYIYRVSVLCVR